MSYKPISIVRRVNLNIAGYNEELKDGAEMIVALPPNKTIRFLRRQLNGGQSGVDTTEGIIDMSLHVVNYGTDSTDLHKVYVLLRTQPALYKNFIGLNDSWFDLRDYELGPCPWLKLKVSGSFNVDGYRYYNYTIEFEELP